MAQKNLLVFLLVAIGATSIAKAQSPLGLVNVNGTLYCSPNGANNGNTTPVFPNAIVGVSCPAYVAANSPASTTTNNNGEYQVVLIPRSDATVNSFVSNCRLFVSTPLSNCNSALPSTGLVSSIRFVRSVSSSRITYMVAAGFTLQM